MIKGFPSYYINIVLKGRQKTVQAILSLVLAFVPLINIKGIISFVIGKSIGPLDIVALVLFIYLILNYIVFEIAIKKLPVAEKEVQVAANPSVEKEEAVSGGEEKKKDKSFIQSINYATNNNKPKLTPKLNDEQLEKLRKAKEIEKLQNINIQNPPEAYPNHNTMDSFVHEYENKNAPEPEKSYDGEHDYEYVEDITDVKEIKVSQTEDHLLGPQIMNDLPEEIKETTEIVLAESGFERGKELFEKKRVKNAFIEPEEESHVNKDYDAIMGEG